MCSSSATRIDAALLAGIAAGPADDPCGGDAGGRRALGSCAARPGRRRALRERPARSLSLNGSDPVPACSGDPSRSAVRRPVARARHQRPHRSPGRHGLDRNDGVDVTAIYWAKTGEFHEVERRPRPHRVRRRGAARSDPPRSRRPTGRRVRARGREARPAHAAGDLRDRELLPRRSGRGRHPAVGARPRGAAIHRPVRRRRGPRDGQAGVRRHDDGRGHRGAAPPGIHGRRSSPVVQRAVHHQASLRRLEHRHRDHRRSDRRAQPWCARRPTTAAVPWSSRISPTPST